MANLNI